MLNALSPEILSNTGGELIAHAEVISGMVSALPDAMKEMTVPLDSVGASVSAKDPILPLEAPAIRERGRPRTRFKEGAHSAVSKETEHDLAGQPFLLGTTAVVDNLRKQGVLKPPAQERASGGPGHRTKNCRPVQIHMSEAMFRQLKLIAATESISIKDQIIAALIKQGYTT